MWAVNGCYVKNCERDFTGSPLVRTLPSSAGVRV